MAEGLVFCWFNLCYCCSQSLPYHLWFLTPALPPNLSLSLFVLEFEDVYARESLLTEWLLWVQFASCQSTRTLHGLAFISFSLSPRERLGGKESLLPRTDSRGARIRGSWKIKNVSLYTGDELIFLDPHTTQTFVDTEENGMVDDQTFHCLQSPQRMNILNLDPSVALVGTWNCDEPRDMPTHLFLVLIRWQEYIHCSLRKRVISGERMNSGANLLSWNTDLLSNEL